MATLSYNGIVYTVDHAVKGTDFIRCYDIDGTLLVAFNGVTDFSGFTFDGTYMEPEQCFEEACNNVKFHEGTLKMADGTPLQPSDYGVIMKSTIVEATLKWSSWKGSDVPYTYTLEVEGVTDTSNQEVLPAIDITTRQLQALQAANIQDGGQSTNAITLKAYGHKPPIDLPIRIVKRSD